MCTFSLPPLAPHHHQNPCAPVTDITHASGIVAAQSPNSATATKGAHQHRKLTVVDPPNGIRAAHVPTAFPVAAMVTELPDDVNRPIGQTYCVGPRNRWRQPIRGCGHHPLQPHRCHWCFVHIVVKLILISSAFSSFNNVDLLRSMSTDCCMPWRRGWSTMAAVGRRQPPC